MTDGVRYYCYSDLDADNIMDETPFLSLNILDVKDRQAPMIGKLVKANFNIDEARAAASNLRYTNGLRAAFTDIYTEPDAEFVRLMARRVYKGMLNANRMEHFTELTKLAFQSFVNDRLNDTLRRAKDIASELPTVAESTSNETNNHIEERKDITVSAEEVQAHELIRTLLADLVEPERITIRDRQSYCNILLDDNQNKTIVRLHFNHTSKKKLSWAESGSNSRGVDAIELVNDLPQYADKMRERVMQFENGARNITLRDASDAQNRD